MHDPGRIANLEPVFARIDGKAGFGVYLKIAAITAGELAAAQQLTLQGSDLDDGIDCLEHITTVFDFIIPPDVRRVAGVLAALSNLPPQRVTA